MLGTPTVDTTADLADWLELLLLTGDPWRVTEANARGQVETAGIAEVFGALVPGAVMKMRRRCASLGDAYPFEETVAGLRRVQLDVTHLPYVALLGLSQWSCLGPGSPSPAASAFEQMCEAILEHMGGPGGQAVHFGWPTRSGRPERFPDAIRWLAGRLGLAPGDGYRDPKRRDGGVDLVAWRMLPDGITYDHRLVQCTVGRDFLRKAREIDIDQWLRWIHFVEPPRIVLTVPYEVSSRDVVVREARAMGSLVLDRAVLVRTAASLPSHLVSSCYGALDSVGLSLRFDPTERSGEGV